MATGRHSASVPVGLSRIRAQLSWRAVLDGLAALVFLAVVVTAFAFIHRSAVNMVYYDQWSDINIIRHAHSGSLSFGLLWAQHNEDRMLFPNLVVLLLGYTTHFNVVVEDYLNGVLCCATVALVILAHKRRSPGVAWIYYCPVALVVFSFISLGDTLFGFNLSWYLTLFGLAVCLYLADRIVLTWFAPALCCRCRRSARKLLLAEGSLHLAGCPRVVGVASPIKVDDARVGDDGHRHDDRLFLRLRPLEGCELVVSFPASGPGFRLFLHRHRKRHRYRLPQHHRRGKRLDLSVGGRRLRHRHLGHGARDRKRAIWRRSDRRGIDLLRLPLRGLHHLRTGSIRGGEFHVLCGLHPHRLGWRLPRVCWSLRSDGDRRPDRDWLGSIPSPVLAKSRTRGLG